jgi:hypothetical protein
MRLQQTWLCQPCFVQQQRPEKLGRQMREQLQQQKLQRLHQQRHGLPLL